jgi:predicted transglutaminase-like cysteine proteinase
MLIRLAALFASSAALAGCSLLTALETQGTMMSTRGYAFAPPAFYGFCASEPKLCSTEGDTKFVRLTPELRAELEEVNRSVNRRIRERSDRRGGGDEWRLPTSEGDCEDFAILKKGELLERGWPASALLLTVVTLAGEGHAVLTVRTDKGDLVLDNRTSAIRDWSRTPYRYFARQAQSDAGDKWKRIRGAVPADFDIE